jgi:hypothetical protein
MANQEARTVSSTVEDREIPRHLWPTEMKVLNALEIRRHRGNVVVVQRISGGVEEGIYLYIPISSYYPQSGDDGFQFEPLGEDLFQYRKLEARF